ncbi:UNVERIFIED_CONTAM: hypothetical protein RMT77_006911 [Armadillidium vulgare]
MEAKIKNAAQRTKTNIPHGSSHGSFLADFIRQLGKEANVSCDRERTFSWGRPDVYINAYGPVEIISKTNGIDQQDRAQAQKYANGSRQKCTLISFGTQSLTPTIQTFYPEN